MGHSINVPCSHPCMTPILILSSILASSPISPDPVQPLSRSPIPSSSAPQSSEQLAGWHSPSIEWTSMTEEKEGRQVIVCIEELYTVDI